MSVFTQKVNPITGKSEWELHPEDYDYQQEIASSAYADMLHDTERVSVDGFRANWQSLSMLFCTCGARLWIATKVKVD